MRIISGTFKARRIEPPSNITARPTTDFAKEGLFNLLANKIDFEQIDVLDLFSGTGSIGFEFISRGCATLTAVELNERQCAFIRKVCNDLKIDNISLLRTDVFRFLKTCRMQFDLVFADPPYTLPNIDTLPNLVFEKNILKPEGLFILEHSAQSDFSAHPHFAEHRKYGNVNFSFFQQSVLLD